MTAQLEPKMNHDARVIGHLAHAADFAGSFLGQKPSLPEQWGTLFDNGTRPTTHGDYPDKETLLEALEENHARLAGAIEVIARTPGTSPITMRSSASSWRRSGTPSCF